jgi:hypothetical protein
VIVRIFGVVAGAVLGVFIVGGLPELVRYVKIQRM